MKIKIFLILLLSILIFTSIRIENVKASVSATQQLEIIQQEIELLQALITNFNLKQEINASSYIATDISDGSVILEKNAEKLYPIASVTKLMNAVISLENIEMDKTIVLTDEMLEPLGQSPCIYTGLKISAEDLFKATLIQSSNDTANSLSYFLGNEKFIKLMNQKAKDLDMQNTVYYDAYGINPNNHSTASDLAKLVSYINKNYPKIWQTTKINNFWLPDSSGSPLKFKNVNNFYPIANFIGGKTGYTIEAKQAIASVFEVNGKKIAIVVLHSANRMADVFNILKQLRAKI